MVVLFGARSVAPTGWGHRQIGPARAMSKRRVPPAAFRIIWNSPAVMRQCPARFDVDGWV